MLKRDIICILKKIEDLCMESVNKITNTLISQIFRLNVLLIESEKRKNYSYNSMKRWGIIFRSTKQTANG